METLLNDIRYALRQFRRNIGVSVAAALTIALVVGANSAIFSVVNGVLLRPLPYPDQDELLRVYEVRRGRRIDVMSPANFLDLREQGQALEVAAFERGEYVLVGKGDPVRLPGAQVSSGMFTDVLRVPPALGRGFRPDDNLPPQPRVVILSHGLWQQRFGANPEVIGQTVDLNGSPYEVVGIMPRDFSFPGDPELWAPLRFTSSFLTSRGELRLTAIARRSSRAPLEQAVAEVETIGNRLAESHPGSNPEFGLAVSSLHDATVGDVRSPLLILQGAVALVLLIGCANVSNLLLARGAERSGELAVRTAMGARRGRLARQLLTESLTLGVIGGTIGLLLVYGGTRFLAAAQPPDLVRVDEVRIDGTVVLFSAALILIASIGSGTLPALGTSRWGTVGRLGQAGRARSTDSGGSRLRALLVVVQTATAVVLLAGAGLLVRSLIELQGVDRGFRSDGALVFDLASRSVEEPVTFYSRVIERLETIPGVQDVGGIQGLPLTGFGFGSTFSVVGREPPGPGERPSVQIRIATPGLFRAMGVPVVRGRGFTPQDREGAPQVALISEAAARRYFPGEDPIGQSTGLPWVRGGRRVGAFEVVGVVGDVRAIDLADAPTEILYLPYAQVAPFAMSIVVRTSVAPLSIAGAVRGAVREIDANVPVDNMRRLDQVVSDSVSRPRFYTSVLSIFAAMAMILAATGIYAVMSYTVTQRTREIGLRLALGAQPAGLLRSVVRRGLKLTLVGLAAGVIGALALTRILSGLLFNVEATDLVTYLAVAAVLGVIAFVASYMPARNAARLDPMVALRAE